MRFKVKNLCLVIPSVTGAKGFLYPADNSPELSVNAGIDVEFLSYVSDQSGSDLQAVAIRNKDVVGITSNDKTGVYWISRTNLKKID